MFKGCRFISEQSLFEVTDQIQQTGQSTNISHMAEFVRVKARAANNRMFGFVIDVVRGKPDDQRRTSKAKGAASPNERVTTLNTQETDPRGRQSSHYTKEVPATGYAICPACNGAHSLVKCKNFVDKNFEERLQVMRKAQLCHNCFKYGHTAVGCQARSTRKVPGCKRRHHSLLHPPSPQHTMESRARVADQGTLVESSTPLRSGQANSTSAAKRKGVPQGRHHTLLHPPFPQHTMESRARVADQGILVESSIPLRSGQANSTSAAQRKGVPEGSRSLLKCEGMMQAIQWKHTPF